MKKKIIAIFTAAIALITCHCSWALAEGEPYADYIPDEIPANLILQPNNPDVVATITAANVFDMAAVGWISGGFGGYKLVTKNTLNGTLSWRGYLTGFEFLCNGKAFASGTTLKAGGSYVFAAAVRNAGTTEKCSINAALSNSKTYPAGVYSAEYGKAGMEVSDKENWTDFKGTFIMPGEADTQQPPRFTIGYPNETEVGSGVEVNLIHPGVQQMYFAQEVCHDIKVSAKDKTDATAGSSMQFTAEIVNQIGLKGNIEQNIIWYVTDENRSEKVPGFDFHTEDGVTTLVTDESVVPGNFVVIAENADNPQMRRGIQITVEKPVINDYVPSGSGQAGEPYSISIECENPQENYTVLKSARLSAKVFDVNHSAEGIEQSFKWFAYKENRQDEEAKINVKTGENSAEAEVSFEHSLPNGTYYVIASYAADESLKMRKGYKLIVNSDIITSDIANDFNTVTESVLAEKMDEYIEFIAKENSVYVNTDKADLCAVIKEMAAESAFTAENISGRFETACVLSLYNKNSANITLNDENGAFIYESEQGLDKIDSDGVTLYEIYNEMLSRKGKENVISALTGNGYRKQSEFIKAFKESVVLSAIAYPIVNGNGYVEEVLTEKNLAAANIDGGKYLTSNSKSKYASAIAGKLFTKSELEKELDKTYSSGGSDNSGSSGGRKSSSTVKTTPVIKGEESASYTFNDLESTHWAYKEIQFLQKLEIVSGDDKGYFNPEAPVKREEIVKMIVTAFKLSGNSSTGFADVQPGAWYEKYISAAVANGIVNGMSEGLFGTGTNVTREDLCVMLARALNKGEASENVLSFTDAEQISDYAKDSVNHLNLLCMISGFEDNTFRPKAPCTRAQAAKVIAHIINYGVKEVNGL